MPGFVAPGGVAGGKARGAGWIDEGSRDGPVLFGALDCGISRKGTNIHFERVGEFGQITRKAVEWKGGEFVVGWVQPVGGFVEPCDGRAWIRRGSAKGDFSSGDLDEGSIDFVFQSRGKKAVPEDSVSLSRKGLINRTN